MEETHIAISAKTPTTEQVEGGLRRLVREGVAAQTMAVLTSGAFLVAFALKLGASNFQIGLLAAIGPLAQLLQLPGTLLVERLRRRRVITVVAAGLARSCWVVIALSPFLFAKEVGLPVLLGSLVVSSALGAVAGCSYNSWLRDLVPQDTMGSFFARRLRWMMGAGIVLSLVAAGYLDFWRKRFGEEGLTGYTILFLVGLAAGLLGLVIMSRIPEPPMAPVGEKQSLVRLLAKPFKDQNFRRLMWFLSAWSFALNLAGPFFMVYMLQRLGLSMSIVIGLSVVSQVMNFAFLRLWGRYTDRFSNKSVLLICGPLLVFSILAWTFTTMPEKHFLTMPLLVAIHAVMGVASSGLALATGNIGLKLAPKGEATVYLATNTIISSFAAGVAPILGGKFADLFQGRELAWTLQYTHPSGEYTLPTLNLQQWDFFFFLAFLLGLYALSQLRKVKETGEVEENVVIHRLMSRARTQVRTLSSVEGLRHMISVPISLWSRLAKKTEDQDATD